MEMNYDVVVVGAGPAGSMAAKYAAIDGAKVLLIEKRQEIGSPVRCGEGIAKSSLSELEIKPDRKWIANEVRGARIFSPSGKFVVLSEKYAGSEVGYVIDRDVFDKALAKEACIAGADIMVKTSAINVIKDDSGIKGIVAKHMGENFEIKAKVVIAADGFESQVARWAGINTSLKPSDVEVCFEYTMVNIDCKSDYNDFYLGSYAPGGYIWVFPKGKDIANVGIGVALSKIKEKAEPKKRLDKFISERKELRKGQAIREIAGGVSTCAPIDQTVMNGFMVVGDAARLIDPLTGGGIANACISGKIAGTVSAKAVKEKKYDKTFLNEYDKKWRERLEFELYRNWIVKEKLIKMDDESLNKIVSAIREYDIEKITAVELLKAVQAKYPELTKEFEDFIS
ncbi:MAG: NAD(P)/FAD-dependent oxidoreductase [Candidatus Thermoplasmatota archaeon]